MQKQENIIKSADAKRDAASLGENEETSDSAPKSVPSVVTPEKESSSNVTPKSNPSQSAGDSASLGNHNYSLNKNKIISSAETNKNAASLNKIEETADKRTAKSIPSGVKPGEEKESDPTPEGDICQSPGDSTSLGKQNYH